MVSTVSSKRKTEDEVHMNGYFTDLVDERFFVDSIHVRAWGERRPVLGDGVELIRDTGIGPASPYAMVAMGRCRLSGNPVQWKFLPAGRRERSAPYEFTLSAEELPVTCEQLLNVVDSVMLPGRRYEIQPLEFTADMTLDMQHCSRHLFTPARTVYEVGDRNGKSMLCVGSPRSAWQLRLYNKTDSIFRCHVTLRKLRLSNARDVGYFRTVDLSRFATWLEIAAPMTALLRLNTQGAGWRLQACAEILDRSTRGFVRMARVDHGVRNLWLRPSAMESRLRHMQRNFIW